MDVQIIQKNLQQQEQVSILLLDIQCQQFGGLITQKANTFYLVENIVRKGFVRKHLIGFEKKEMLPLTKEQIKSYKDAKACYISGKRILKFTKDKNYRNVRDHCHYTGKYKGAAYSICKLKFRVS